MSSSRFSTPPAPLAAAPSPSDPEPRPALPRPAASVRGIYSFDLFAALIALAKEPAERVLLLAELLDERHQVEEAYRWYMKEHIEVTPALLDTCFVPPEREGRTLCFEERTYDREIERKVRILIEMKKMARSHHAPKGASKVRNSKKKRGLKNSSAKGASS